LQQNIRIVTDSTADIPLALAAEYGIEVLPLTVVFGDKSYRDGIDITPAEFYQKLERSPELPKTSQVTPGAFMECFQRHVREGARVISIHLSQGLSSTVETARSIAEQVDSEKISVVDSKFLCWAQAFQAVEAAQMAKAGKSVDEILARLERMRSGMELLFTLDTLEYLKKGGRIGKVSATIGSLLNLKPLIRVQDGVYVSFGRVRSQLKAMDEMVQYVVKKVGDAPVRIVVAHGKALAAAERLREKLLSGAIHVVGEVPIYEVGPVIGVHTGPGTLGLACYPVAF
jgi:DegV family protein with EDD domain